MQKTINLTQHATSSDQVEVGVIDLPNYIQGRVKDLLTFSAIPPADDISHRAVQLAYLANNASWELAEKEASALAPYYWERMSTLPRPLPSVGANSPAS